MTGVLSDLSRRTRLAQSDRELGFVLVNDSMALAPYRQAVLWLSDVGAWSLSGVVQVDANVPYVQWLNAVAQHLQSKMEGTTGVFTAKDLPEALAADWASWWPTHAVGLSSGAAAVAGAGSCVRDQPWEAEELTALQEWSEVWWYAFSAVHRPRLGR